MATVNGTNYAIAAAPTPSTLLDAAKASGKVRVWYDTYECASTASGTVINIALLPQKAVVVGGLILTDALGTGVTLSCGDTEDSTASDADRYMSAVSAASAARLDLFDTGSIGKHPYTFQQEAAVTLTVGGAAATGTIKTWIFYAVE